MATQTLIGNGQYSKSNKHKKKTIKKDTRDTIVEIKEVRSAPAHSTSGISPMLTTKGNCWSTSSAIRVAPNLSVRLSLHLHGVQEFLTNLSGNTSQLAAQDTFSAIHRSKCASCQIPKIQFTVSPKEDGPSFLTA